jgi:hypothetical protein
MNEEPFENFGEPFFGCVAPPHTQKRYSSQIFGWMLITNRNVMETNGFPAAM